MEAAAAAAAAGFTFKKMDLKVYNKLYIMPPQIPTNSCCRGRKQAAPAAVCQHTQHHANNHKTKEKKAFIICVINVRVLTPACRPAALEPVWKERSGGHRCF